jgi:hypothetical protein
MSANIYKWTVPSGQIVGVHPESFVFSSLEPGLRSDTVSVDFVNHGSDPVTLSSIAIQGTEFTVTKQPTLPANLSSFGSVRVELCFTPHLNGTLRDSIVFVSNASNAPRLAVSLEGRGVILQPAQAGVLYATGTQGGGELYTLSTTTGQVTVVGKLGDPEIASMAIRPTDGKIYGIGLTGNSTLLYKIDPQSGAAVRTVTVPLGNLRAITMRSDTLLVSVKDRQPSTTINYSLPKASHVKLKVFNALGQEISTCVDKTEEPGYKSVEWNASGVASGVYFYRLQAGDFVHTKKLLLLR